MSTTSTSPTRRSSASVRPEDMALRDYMVVLAAALVSSAVGAAEPAAKLSPVMSGTVHQALFSISLDGNTGYATGAAGEILQTGDGGASWKTMTPRSEEHTSELQSLMRISYAVFCLKKKKNNIHKIKQTYKN